MFYINIAYCSRGVGEVGATPILLSLDVNRWERWVKTPSIISDGVYWKPGQLSFKHTKKFPEIFFRLGAGAKIPKMAIFGVASKLLVKPNMAENCLGQSRKKYYITLAQYFVVLHRR